MGTSRPAALLTDADQALELDVVLRRFRLKRAAKITFAVLIAATVCFVWHLELGYFMGLVTMFTMVFAPGHEFADGARMVIAAFCAGLITSILILLFADAGVAFLIVSLVFLCLWLAYIPSDHLVPYLVGGIVFATLIFARVFEGGQAALHAFPGIVARFAVAWVIMSVVERVIWPENPITTFRLTLARLFRDLGELTEQSVSQTKGEGLKAPQELSSQAFQELLQVSRFMRSRDRQEGYPRVRIATACHLLFRRLDYILRRLSDGPHFAIVRVRNPELPKRLLRELIGVFYDTSHQIVAGSPLRIDWSRVQSTLDEVDAEYRRSKHASKGEAAVDSDFPVTRSLLATTQEFVIDYNEFVGSGAPAPTSSKTSAHTPLRLQTDPEKLHRGGRVVLIVLILIAVSNLFSLPPNTPFSFYVIGIGAAANMGQVRWNGQTGVIGALIALVYGIAGIVVLSYAPHLPLFYLIYGLGLLVGLYVTIGSERYGSAGFQGALLVPFTFLIYNGPVWTLEDAVVRTIALALAAIVVLVVMRYVWPLDPVRQFRRSAAKVMRTCPDLFPLDPAHRTGAIDWRAQAQKIALWTEDGQKLSRDSAYLMGSTLSGESSFVELLGGAQNLFVQLTSLRRLLHEDLTDSLGEGDARLIERFLPAIVEPLSAIRIAFLEAADRLDEVPSSARHAQLNETRARIHGEAARFLEGVQDEDGVRPGDRKRFGVFIDNLLDITREWETISNAIEELPPSKVPRRQPRTASPSAETSAAQ